MSTSTSIPQDRPASNDHYAVLWHDERLGRDITIVDRLPYADALDLLFDLEDHGVSWGTGCGRWIVMRQAP